MSQLVVVKKREPRAEQVLGCKNTIQLLSNAAIVGLYKAAGSGKTWTARLIHDELIALHGEDYQMAFISPLNTVTTQTLENFPNCGLYQTGSKKKPTNGSQMTLFTKNTFENMFTKKKGKLMKIPYSLIMIDEVQMLLPFIRTLTKKIKKENLPIKLVYLTATPYDKSGYILDICENVPKAMEWKYINPSYYQNLEKPTLLPGLIKVMADSPIDEDKLYKDGKLNTNKDGNFSHEIDNEAVKNSIDVAKSFDEQHKLVGGQTIVIASSIIHAEKLAADFRELGYSCEAMHSGLKKEKKGKKDKDVLARFKAETIQIIVSIRQIAVGTDIPTAINIVWAALIGSLAYFVQSFARTLRLGGGAIARGFDYFGNVKRLGSPLQKVTPKPLSEKNSKKKTICPECGEIEKKVLVDTYVEDNIKWSVFKRLCCDTTDIKGTELPTHICSKCNTAYLINEQERVDNELYSICPECGNKDLIETFEQIELITLVDNREEFATTTTAIIGNIIKFKTGGRATFFKHQLIFSMFETDEVLRAYLETILNGTDKEKALIVEKVVSFSLNLIKKWGFIIALMGRVSDFHKFSQITRLATESENKVKSYPIRLMHKFRRWNIGGGKGGSYPIDDKEIKRILRNMRTHVTECIKYDKNTTSPKQIVE